MGTMAQADKKNERRFFIGFTIVQIIIIILTVTSVGHTYFHDWWLASSGFFKFLGILFHVVSIAWLWLANKIFVGTVSFHPGVFWLAFLLLGMGFSFGFNCF